MDYLHAFGYARSQSVGPCYLRSDHDFYMYFRQFIFRLISDKFRQSMGYSRWPCHGLSRSVTAFSDNAQDLSIFFCLLSRFVTQHVRQFEANMNLFPITCNLRLLHFDNACAICDHQKWFIICMHFRFDRIYAHGSSGIYKYVDIIIYTYIYI